MAGYVATTRRAPVQLTIITVTFHKTFRRKANRSTAMQPRTNPGGAAAEMPVQCRRDSHQLGMGEGVEQHPLPATLTCHRATLPQHQ